MVVVLIPRPQLGKRHPAALLDNFAEGAGHLVLLRLRKLRADSHRPSKLALPGILPIVPWFDSFHQLADLVSLANEAGDVVPPIPVLGHR